MWQRYFGLGLVETEADFGSQGTPPSHPRLLDWLASELVRRDWSMKAMHRLIVTSATYRQSSEARPELSEVDPATGFWPGRTACAWRPRLSGMLPWPPPACSSPPLEGRVFPASTRGVGPVHSGQPQVDD